MENYDWITDVNKILLKNLSEEKDKEIEEYLDSFEVERDKTLDTTRLPLYPKPSFSIRAEKWIKLMINNESNCIHCMHMLTHQYEDYISSMVRNKYQSYHKPPQNEYIISKNTKNKFDEWRTKIGIK